MKKTRSYSAPHNVGNRLIMSSAEVRKFGREDKNNNNNNNVDDNDVTIITISHNYLLF